MSVKADLHIHSLWSDGSLSVETILKQGQKLGLTHMAFSEHDFVSRAEETVQRGEAYGIRVIPAVELSAWDLKTGRKAHLLGYGYGRTEAIEALSAPILARRHKNCLKQIDILKKMNYRISAEDVLPYALGGILYKQHILKYLVDSGQSSELFGTVYKTIFKNGGPCDFDIDYVDVRDAVSAICDDGGLPVLAHPGQQKNLDLVPELASMGLAGIELFHPANDPRVQEEIRHVAGNFRLFCTGGSDFHGEYENGSRPLGSFLAPEDCPLVF